MKLADGIAEVHRVSEGFADDAEAAAYWAMGAADVPAEDFTLPGAAGQEQAARLYRGREGAPVLMYIHGGGWAGGSIALNHYSAAGICARSGWNVLGVSYRLAPAHPYPAGLEDCAAALRWLRTHGPALGLRGPVALGGASAGANLALALALRRPGPLAGLLLFYGVFGADLDTESYRTYSEGPGLTRARMAMLFDMYDPAGNRRSDPLIAPLLSDPAGLPPACLIAAEHDVLLSDSIAMAESLARAGVPAELHIEAGVTHGFINRGRLVPAADACIARASRFLTRLETP